MSAVVVEIGADVTSFTKAINNLPNNIRSATSGLQKTLSGIGFAYLAKEAVEIVGKFDRMERGMTTLTGSAEGARRRMDELREASKLPGVDFAQAVQADIKLQSVGVSAEMSKEAIIQFGNALSLAGGTAQDLDGVILALTQIISKGKVSAEEINQIAERVPQVRKVMKEAFGTADTEALQKMNISAEEFVETLTQGFAQLDRASAGLDEKFADITTTIDVAVNALMKGLVNEGTGGLSQLSAAVQENLHVFEALGVGIGNIGSIAVQSIGRATAEITDLLAIGGLVLGGEADIGDAARMVQQAREAQLQAQTAASGGGGAGGIGPMAKQAAGVNLFAAIMQPISTALSDALGPMSQVIGDQMMEQSRKFETAAKDLQSAAFSPMRGDVDVSFGRGGSVNPLRSGAANMIKELNNMSKSMADQVKLTQKGNAYLSEIEKAMRGLNIGYK
jgi:tape measure domain-containing protein